VPLTLHFFKLEGQKRSPAREAVDAVPERFGAAIYLDLEVIAEHVAADAPASVKSITGHTPLKEIRTGGYRAFFVVDRGELWVLHCCKKQDQRRGIELAAQRMKLVLER
jgi:phage-related protein